MILVLAVNMPFAANSKAIKVIVEGQEIKFTDAAPTMDENNRILVPARAMLNCETYNFYKINWNQAKRQVTISDAGKSITFEIGKKTAYVQYSYLPEYNKPKTINMDTSAKIINNRIFIPVRSFAELLYGEVKWDGKNKVVTVINNAVG
jgi:hypothetical protein